MKSFFREHYGQKFYLNLEKTPAKAVDRLSSVMLFFGFVCGILFFFCGICLVSYNAVVGPSDLDAITAAATVKPYTLVSTQTFSYILLVLGVGLVLFTTYFDLRFKVVSFDGEKISVSDFPFFGRANNIAEKISSYAGVRLRLKFCQYGIINKNKYIIELYHKDHSKIVPLYISTNPKNIRSLWKQYAATLNLPPISVSDKGMISYNLRDMDRSYVDVVKSWHLPEGFLSGKTHSQVFVVKQRQDKKMIKMRHFIYDFYSNLNVACTVIFTVLLSYGLFCYDTLTKHVPPFFVFAFYIFLLGLIFYAFCTLFMRDTLLMHNKKFILFRKVLGFSYQDTIIPYASLKSINISYTPTTDRYALNLLTEKESFRVFNKMSPDDLRWIKGFLVSEITQ